jgi:hypothetical protein
MEWKDVIKIIALMVFVAVLAFLTKLFFWKLVLG